MRGLDPLSSGELAIMQGVGYPNPDHSHFESMDIWRSADPNVRTLRLVVKRVLQDRTSNA